MAITMKYLPAVSKYVDCGFRHCAIFLSTHRWLIHINPDTVYGTCPHEVVIRVQCLPILMGALVHEIYPHGLSGPGMPLKLSYLLSLHEDALEYLITIVFQLFTLPDHVDAESGVNLDVRVCDDHQASPTVLNDIIHELHRLLRETSDVVCEILVADTVPDVDPVSVKREFGLFKLLILGDHLLARGVHLLLPAGVVEP
jgi:hypothetical protein